MLNYLERVKKFRVGSIISKGRYIAPRDSLFPRFPPEAMFRFGDNSASSQKASLSVARVRVLFFTAVPNFKGGAERSLFDLMSNPHIDPFLVVPAKGPISERAEALGIPCDAVDFRDISTIRRPFQLVDGVGAVASLIRAAYSLNKIARKREAQIVHSNGLKAHAIALVANKLGGCPTIIHLRDIANTKFEKIIWKMFQRGADHTILVSRACFADRRLPANVHVIHNGFRYIVRGERAVVHQKHVVLGFTAGRIHPSKGLHVLLDGVAVALAMNCELHLIVRGAFAEETPEYEREIRGKILTLGLKHFVTIEDFVTDTNDVYKNIDIVCVPSILPDPFPRSVMEAMGMGLVVVAAPCGGIPEMIVDGKTGFLVNSPAEFGAIIVRLQKDLELRTTVGNAARVYCRAYLNLERLHREVHHVYEIATNSSSRR